MRSMALRALRYPMVFVRKARLDVGLRWWACPRDTSRAGAPVVRGICLVPDGNASYRLHPPSRAQEDRHVLDRAGQTCDSQEPPKGFPSRQEGSSLNAQATSLAIA